MLATLTFDDGNTFQYEELYPILEKYGLKATFYLVTGTISEEGRITWREVADLHKHRNEIGSHTHTHVNLTSISDEVLDFELRTSLNKLELYNVETLAYPYGRFDQRVVRFTMKYYKAGRGTFTPSEFHTKTDKMFRFNLCSEEERYKLKAIDMEFTFPPRTPIMCFPTSKFKSIITEMLERNIHKDIWIIFTFHGLPTLKERSLMMPKKISGPNFLTSALRRIYGMYKGKRRIKDYKRKFDWLCERLNVLPIKTVTVSEAIRYLHERKAHNAQFLQR